jgi:molybdate transport system permease protein
MPVDRYWLGPGAEAVGLATALAVILGVPLAWALQNRRFPGKPILEAVARAATALPAPLLCYYVLARSGHVWSLTRHGLAAAGLLSALPLLLRRSSSSFASLNPSYGKAARSLGTPEWRVFARVDLPLVWRSILNSAVWALVRLLLELVAALWISEAGV